MKANTNMQDKHWPFMENADTRSESNIFDKLTDNSSQGKNTPDWLIRCTSVLGLTILHHRQETAGLTRSELSRKSALDPDFIALLENGIADPYDITSNVISALKKGLGPSITVNLLESAFSPHESSYAKTSSGSLIESVISLFNAPLGQSILTYKSGNIADSGVYGRFLQGTDSEIIDDDEASVSYILRQAEGESLPSICFYNLGNSEDPLQDWDVSLRSGMSEISRGVTDGFGEYKLSTDLDSLPEDTYLVLRRR